MGGWDGRVWGRRACACGRAGDVGCFPLGCRTAEADEVPNCRMTVTQWPLCGAYADPHHAPRQPAVQAGRGSGAGGVGPPVVCRGAVPSPLHLTVPMGSSRTPGQKAWPHGAMGTAVFCALPDRKPLVTRTPPAHSLMLRENAGLRSLPLGRAPGGDLGGKGVVSHLFYD